MDRAQDVLAGQIVRQPLRHRCFIGFGPATQREAARQLCCLAVFNRLEGVRDKQPSLPNVSQLRRHASVPGRNATQVGDSSVPLSMTLLAPNASGANPAAPGVCWTCPDRIQAAVRGPQLNL